MILLINKIKQLAHERRVVAGGDNSRSVRRIDEAHEWADQRGGVAENHVQSQDGENAFKASIR